jgi:hypothetical protein
VINCDCEMDAHERVMANELSHAAGDCRQPETRSKNRPA